ncbi:MAG: acyltransferase [Pseudomonadota bacterium]
MNSPATAIPDPHSGHQHQLDGWRGAAVALLLLGHFYPLPGINIGAVGVNLFFVLSGLLMGRLLFVKQVALPLFYRRRIARIFPAAFAFIVFWTLLALLRGQTIAWSEVAAAASFTNNYFLATGDALTLPFQHFWSLSVEEHSYIVLSLLALGVRAAYFSARAALTVLVLAISGILVFYATNFTHPHLFELWRHTEVAAYGIAVSALIMLVLEKRQLALPAWVAPLLLCVGVALHWWIVPIALKSLAGITALAVSVNLLARADGWVRAVFSFYPLRLLGLWSFSVYIWQQPFHVMVEYGQMAPSVGLLLGLLCGIVSYYAIEQPARTWLNRHWRGEAASHAPVVQAAS